jgi:hypothetical protein
MRRLSTTINNINDLILVKRKKSGTKNIRKLFIIIFIFILLNVPMFISKMNYFLNDFLTSEATMDDEAEFAAESNMRNITGDFNFQGDIN